MVRHVARVIMVSENNPPTAGRKRPADGPAAASVKRERERSSAAEETRAGIVVRRAGEVTDLTSGSQGAGGVFQATDSGRKPAEVSLALRQSWSSDTGRCVDASPVLLVHGRTGGATVFIGSHSHRFQALDLTSGSCLWERVLGDRIESSAAVSICGSLVVVGQHRLFTGGFFGVFFCF